MNIRRVLRNAPVESQLRGFLSVSPASVEIRNAKGKRLLAIGDDAVPHVYPLAHDGESLGALHCSDDGDLAAYMVQLLQQAIEREAQVATLTDETLLMYREVNLLYDLSVQLSSLKGRDNRLTFVMQQCAENLGAADASLWLQQESELVCAYSSSSRLSRRFRPGEGIIGHVVTSGKGEMLNAPIEDERWAGPAEPKVSMIVVPLKTDEKTFGALLVCKRDGSHFMAKDLMLANVFNHYSTREVENAEMAHELRVAQALLKEANQRVAGPLLGESECVRALRDRIKEHAQSDAPILLNGPQGAGDEAIARRIHQHSPRGGNPFIYINCAQYQAPSGKSTRLFRLSGAEGAEEEARGMFELADGGTIYLDGVHLLPHAQQVQLHEILIEHRLKRQNGECPSPDVRILSYTSVPVDHPNYAKIIETALLKELSALQLKIPPLRERRDDIPVLADFFVQEYSRRMGKSVLGVAEESMARVVNYDWPGNIRELRNVLERAVVTTVDPVLEISEEFFDGGRRVDRYRLIEKLGQGGMGEVWRAKHQLLARPAALKLILTDGLQNEEKRRRALKRFEREAQATANLQSPNTIRLFDYGVTDEGAFYFVMELLQGMDLGEIVDRFGPMRPARVVYLLRQVCRSLMEAHAAGMVHRDIKPQNLFVCKLGPEFDFLKVLDFGIVQHDESSETEMDEPNVIPGSPMSVAPELIEKMNAKIDGRADIYSLGCVAYWLLTRRRVFETKTVAQMLLMHLSQVPEPPSQASGLKIPKALDDLIMACLEKRPENRPESAYELWKRLGAISFREPWTQSRARQWWQERLPRLAQSDVNPVDWGDDATQDLSAMDKTLLMPGTASTVVMNRDADGRRAEKR